MGRSALVKLDLIPVERIHRVNYTVLMHFTRTSSVLAHLDPEVVERISSIGAWILILDFTFCALYRDHPQSFGLPPALPKFRSEF